MNADSNPRYTRTFHPSRVDGEAIQALALWLKAHGSPETTQPDWHRVMTERYPAGLFSEDEMLALFELIDN